VTNNYNIKGICALLPWYFLKKFHRYLEPASSGDKKGICALLPWYFLKKFHRYLEPASSGDKNCPNPVQT
jgi:hypothetical protein